MVRLHKKNKKKRNTKQATHADKRLQKHSPVRQNKKAQQQSNQVDGNGDVQMDEEISC